MSNENLIYLPGSIFGRSGSTFGGSGKIVERTEDYTDIGISNNLFFESDKIDNTLRIPNKCIIFEEKSSNNTDVTNFVLYSPENYSQEILIDGEKANFKSIVVDNYGYKSFGYYGKQGNETPTITKYSKTSMLWGVENHYQLPLTLIKESYLKEEILKVGADQWNQNYRQNIIDDLMYIKKSHFQYNERYITKMEGLDIRDEKGYPIAKTYITKTHILAIPEERQQEILTNLIDVGKKLPAPHTWSKEIFKDDHHLSEKPIIHKINEITKTLPQDAYNYEYTLQNLFDQEIRKEVNTKGINITDFIQTGNLLTQETKKKNYINKEENMDILKSTEKSNLISNGKHVAWIAKSLQDKLSPQQCDEYLKNKGVEKQAFDTHGITTHSKKAVFINFKDPIKLYENEKNVVLQGIKDDKKINIGIPNSAVYSKGKNKEFDNNFLLVDKKFIENNPNIQDNISSLSNISISKKEVFTMSKNSQTKFQMDNKVEKNIERTKQIKEDKSPAMKF